MAERHEVGKDFVAHIWRRTAAEIIAKVRRGRSALDDVTKSATDH